MDPQLSPEPELRSTVTVRYWAAARAATGVQQEEFAAQEPMSVADLSAEVHRRHPGAQAVIAACSVLINDRPLGGTSPDRFAVHAGDAVEFLPPFAGG